MEFEGLHSPAEEDMLADRMTRMRGPTPNNVHRPLSSAMLEFLKGCPSFNTSLEGKLCTVSGTLVYDATALVIRPGPEAPFVQAWQQTVEAAREECLGGICEKKIAIPKEQSEHYTDFFFFLQYSTYPVAETVQRKAAQLASKGSRSKQRWW